MELERTGFSGLFLLTTKMFADHRGYFMESYNLRTFRQLGIDITFVQDNQSSSRRGVLRGLHFQNPPFAQTKLVRVLHGTILDVVVDLRRDQPTYGKHFAAELSAENHKQLLIPKGFAHGFVVLSDQTEVLYKSDEFYHPKTEGGIIYNDPALKIDWKIPAESLALSEKDSHFPRLSQSTHGF